jgi:glucose-1-phosphate adenylyltransferase
MNDVLGIIMGGGRGSRLHPLTKMRSKPAVPIAGKYRLIDIPISNCINSGIYRVAILTHQGTADAVRKQLFEIQASGAEYVLILAGDHLYRMDYREMANFLWEKSADIAVAVQPVVRSEASRFGILKVESDSRISAFVEKPKDPDVQ